MIASSTPSGSKRTYESPASLATRSGASIAVACWA
jgi:hypothetical protein